MKACVSASAMYNTVSKRKGDRMGQRRPSASAVQPRAQLATLLPANYSLISDGSRRDG